MQGGCQTFPHPGEFSVSGLEYGPDTHTEMKGLSHAFLTLDTPFLCRGHAFCRFTFALREWEPCRKPRFNPWVGKIPWRRAWYPTPMFLPEESHGQRNLVGYSPRGHKELDTTKRLTLTHAYLGMCVEHTKGVMCFREPWKRKQQSICLSKQLERDVSVSLLNLFGMC